MAATHAITDDQPELDYAEHLRTYTHFLKLVKYVVIGVVCLLIFMAVVLL
jgi:hypothetical protein